MLHEQARCDPIGDCI
ncbi:hypothetical protein VTH82DRAFT_1877 [Thermothelomyces myriococcoides]